MTFLLGITVLIGGYINSGALIQVLPQFTLMPRLVFY